MQSVSKDKRAWRGTHSTDRVWAISKCESPQNTGRLVFVGWVISRLMRGRIIPTTLGKGWGFPGIGLLPASWPFLVSLEAIMAPVSVLFSMLIYYNVCIMRLGLPRW